MTYNVTIFGLHLKINPVAFTLPWGSGWSVYWYGILIATGFLLALVYGYRYAKLAGVRRDRMLDVVLVTTPVSILCARLYYIIFYREPVHSVADFFGFNHGGFSGLAIYGAVIGSVVCCVIMCRLRGIKLANMLDLAAVGYLIAQGVGRWGNFFNQEAFGSATGSSWFGMTSENVAAELGEGVLAHPCFLYESILCLVGAFLLHKALKRRQYGGQVALLYCVWYGTGRAVIEGLRTDSLYIGSFRVSQLLSIAAAVTGAAVLLVKGHKLRVAAADGDYSPVFETDSGDEEGTAEAEAPADGSAEGAEEDTVTVTEDDTADTPAES